VLVSKSNLAKGQRDSGETVVFAFKVRFLPLEHLIQKSDFNSDRKNPLACSCYIFSQCLSIMKLIH